MLICGFGQFIITQNLNRSLNIKTHGKNKLKDLHNLLQKMHKNTNTINFLKSSNFEFQCFTVHFSIQ